ncbi:complex I assembly factor TMEM126B, mitochondrial isoform X2 [Ornithorhynchus anatinus]|uniref:complex I assembly factor TMEM126B, mitochondrial isoform X2 n=1 Tax=Ornithorhynchus anatinus TaxID=9258 RepID=UPI0010A77733|nr:complex I assembly factor TMEM126B, mitochondrial isoform X2 [Ornithorhynchus anatinus]
MVTEGPRGISGFRELPGLETQRAPTAPHLSASAASPSGREMTTPSHTPPGSSVVDAAFGRLRIPHTAGADLGRLNPRDRRLYAYGPLYLGSTAAVCGVLANYLLRRNMKVTQRPLKTYAPLAVIPFLSTAVVYRLLVVEPLNAGDLTQEQCVLRGGFCGLTLGAGYPTALAFLKNGRLAVKYETVPPPPRGRAILYWAMLCHPACKLMSLSVVVQLFFGGLLGYRHHEISRNPRG